MRVRFKNTATLSAHHAEYASAGVGKIDRRTM